MGERLVRVFVSSTFRDLQLERDFLVTRVFPELRRRCRERAIEFVEIDLRWGITVEQFQRGEVLQVCLAEIDRCRPYFVGLLGERYGWIPSEIDDDVKADHPWLDALSGRSITELEILHGVLRDQSALDRSVFYFRDPAYIEQLPPQEQAAHRSSGLTEKERLANLKDSIRGAGVTVRENFPNAETLGSLVMEDLWGLIQGDFPGQNLPTPWEIEDSEHDAYARSRRGVYIGREEYFDALDRAAIEDGPPLVVTGESGSGKSALLANWVERAEGKHRETAIFFHHIGANAVSADYHHLLRRLAEWLRTRGLIEETIATDPGGLASIMPGMLRRAGEKSRIIIVLDALDRLNDSPGAFDLDWIALWPTKAIRVISSALPSSPMDSILSRGWPLLRVEPLDLTERAELIDHYLLRFSKRLSRELAERIAASEQASNPLHLKLLLGELRVFGRHEKLSEAVDHYLQPISIAGLYELVLERMERDFDLPTFPLVSRVMTLLWGARRGLSELELAELLGSVSDPLPRRNWSPLFLGLEESLINRGGFLSFSHDFLRQAVERRYLSSTEAKQNAHKPLMEAALDWQNPARSRSLIEYSLRHGPAHLQACERLDDLWNLVMNDSFIEAQASMFEDDIATFDGFRRLLEMLGRQDPCGGEHDARLASAGLKAASLAHQSSRGIGEAFRRLRSSSLDDVNRLENFTENLSPLDDSRRYDAALVGIWIEARRQLSKEGTPDPWVTLGLCKWVLHNVATDVAVVNWARDFDVTLIKHLCIDLLRLLPPREVADLITRADHHSRGGLFPLVELMTEDDPDDSPIAQEVMVDFVLAVGEFAGRVKPSGGMSKTEIRCRIPHAAIRYLARARDFPGAIAVARTLEPAAQVTNALRRIAVEAATGGELPSALEVAGMIESPERQVQAFADIALTLWIKRRSTKAHDILMETRKRLDALAPCWLTTDARESFIDTLAGFGLFPEAFAQLKRIDREVTRRDLLVRIGQNLASACSSVNEEWVIAMDAMLGLSVSRYQEPVAVRFSELLAEAGDLPHLEMLVSRAGHLFNARDAFAACHAKRGDLGSFKRASSGLAANRSVALLLAKGGRGHKALQYASEIEDEQERASATADLAEEFSRQNLNVESALAWDQLLAISEQLRGLPLGNAIPSLEWKRGLAVVTATSRLATRSTADASVLWNPITRWLNQLPEAYFENGYTYSAFSQLTHAAGLAAASGEIDAAIRILELAPGKYRHELAYGRLANSGGTGVDGIESGGARDTAISITVRSLCSIGRISDAVCLIDLIAEHEFIGVSGFIGCAALKQGDLRLARKLWKRGIVPATKHCSWSCFFEHFQDTGALNEAGKLLPANNTDAVRAIIHRFLRVGDPKSCLPWLRKIRGTSAAAAEAPLVWAELGDFTAARYAGLSHIGRVPLPTHIDFVTYVGQPKIDGSRKLQFYAAVHSARQSEESGNAISARAAWNLARYHANSERERIMRGRMLEELASLMAANGRWDLALEICPRPDLLGPWIVSLVSEALGRRDIPLAERLLLRLDEDSLKAESLRLLSEGFSNIGDDMRAGRYLHKAFELVLRCQPDSDFELGYLAKAAVNAGFPSLIHEFSVRASLPVSKWESMLTVYWEALVPGGVASLRWFRLSFAYVPFTPRLAFYGTRMFLATLVNAGETTIYNEIVRKHSELGLPSLLPTPAVQSDGSPRSSEAIQNGGFSKLLKWLFRSE